MTNLHWLTTPHTLHLHASRSQSETLGQLYAPNLLLDVTSLLTSLRYMHGRMDLLPVIYRSNLCLYDWLRFALRLQGSAVPYLGILIPKI